NVFNKVIRGCSRPQEIRNMAKRASEETSVPRRRFELRDLWRVALWGMTAAAALLLAVLATTTDAGNDRLILALAHFRGAAGPPASPPQPQSPLLEPASGRTEFGIDLGSATTVEGLRVLWTNAKAKHGSLLDGLRPVMTVRDHARPGGVELRLVAGPLTNAT